MSRSISSALSLILRSLEEGSNSYKIVFDVLSEFNQTDDTMACAKLDESSNSMLIQTREWMKYMKFAYYELTS